MSSSRTKGSSSSGRATPARGNTCLNCRQAALFLKCDGQRPVCRPCSTSVSYGDCEYPELGGGMTRTQALEEQIAILESRIQQLEDPGNPGGAILLAQPYASSAGSDLVVNEGVSELSTVVQAVLQNSTEIGFFLHPSRFIHSLSSPHQHGRPLVALMSCILLWGSHLYASKGVNTILARALRDTAQGLASGHPQAVMHCIQAERAFVEAKYHTSAAVSIALGAQLHKTDAPSHALALPPPADTVEEGERINGFWTVFILSSCWSAVDGSPSPFPYPSSPDARVDVPWPLDIESYQPQASRPPGRGTVQRFLENQGDSGTSTLALHAKASILFTQVSRIVQGYRPGMNQQQSANFFGCYNALQTAIESFTAKLPPPTTSATAVVTHSLAHAAMIRMHAPFLSMNPPSRGRMTGSMRALVRIIDAVDIPGLPVVDSIIGMIWARACQVLIPERPAAGSELARVLASILSVMERMRARYPVINDQLAEVRAAQS
ncbi:hypothetical protein BDZ89DRAFT_1073731 [Hymenopellis radicata]|nr:hypothetical protein BDZ89DRAFT_1073731 [Hymenopellis radicata]